MQPPPPVLDCARVLSYAFVHDIPYRKWGTLSVDGKPLEHVPRLAICRNLGEDEEDDRTLLFHCDDDWNVLGGEGGDAVEEMKARAEKNYPGVASRWVDVNTSVEDALRYYDAEFGEETCSFCGRRAFDVETWFGGNSARVCNHCIEKVHGILETGGDSG